MGQGARVSRSVLVVDDEPGIIEMASAYLRRDGFMVRTAATGQRALDSVLTQMPDLVVLDLMLPDIPGEQVCASLRRHSAVPIIMLTAKSAEVDGCAASSWARTTTSSSRSHHASSSPASARSSGAPPARRSRRPTCWSSTAAASRSTSPRTRRALRRPAAAHRHRVPTARRPGPPAAPRLLALRAPQAVQGTDVEGFERTVDVHVMRLRKKMDEAAPAAPIHRDGLRRRLPARRARQRGGTTRPPARLVAAFVGIAALATLVAALLSQPRPPSELRRLPGAAARRRGAELGRPGRVRLHGGEAGGWTPGGPRSARPRARADRVRLPAGRWRARRCSTRPSSRRRVRLPPDREPARRGRDGDEVATLQL